MMKDALKLQNYELLSQKAYRVLKEAIVRGDIKSNLEGLIAELATKLDYNELDIKFHDFLLNIAGNNKLKEVYNRLILQDHKFRFRTLKLDHRMQKSLEEHKKIALKIKERDAIAATRASQEHIKSIMQSLEEDEMRKENI